MSTWKAVGWRFRVTLAGMILMATMTGCTGSPAPVKGKVTYDGEPVTEGTIMFSPIYGPMSKTAGGAIELDGSYTLTTIDSTIGAWPGRYRVGYTIPPIELADQEKAAEDPTYVIPPFPYSGLVPKQREVEVKPGDNTINIELEPKR